MAAQLLHLAPNLTRRTDLLNPNNDPNIGSARGDNRTAGSETLDSLGVNATTSGSALLTTFVPAFIFAMIWIALFLVFRRRQHRFYAPKSYLGHLHEYERSPELPGGWLNWFGKFWQLPDSYVLRNSSLDAYLFLRFLKLMSLICFVGCLLVWPILFPINITGGAGNTELDLLSFSNVANPERYYAHTLVSFLFFGFVFYMVTRESVFYVSLRQVYLLSPLYANRISSRTVLFLSVPRKYLDKSKLTRIFGNSVRRIWITPDCSKLEELVAKRNDLAYRLEEAETRLVKAANAARIKALKLQQQDQESGLQAAQESEDGKLDANTASPWALKVKRPTHRLRFFGKKVDTIDYLRSELAKVVPQVNELQEKYRRGEVKSLSAVFIEFNTQTDAQIAYQTLSHHHPFRMTPRFIGIQPEHVVWSALHYSWWQRIIRKFALLGFITALIIFWSVPSALVGTISNVSYLTNLVPFLKFIDKLPRIIKGVISGLLPTVALALLMALVPVILRLCARQMGMPSTARVELFTQNAHFCFQVVQVFLVTTITSAASAATTQIIQDPLSAKDLLATNLPKASNFYISYFLFQGLIMSSGAVVQVIAFLVFKLLRILFDKTPRKLYERWARLGTLPWGTVFPVFTNMGVIAITYSCIAPLILGFASIGLYLVYLAYRYNILFVYDVTVDTKGLIYPRALQQVLTGIYLAEVCMIGLFAIRAAVKPLVMMGIFTVLTVLAHISLNEALDPLLNALPRTLDATDDEEEVESPCDNSTSTGQYHGKGEELIGERFDKHEDMSVSGTTKSAATIITATTLPTPDIPTRRRNRLSALVDWALPRSIYTDYSTLRRKMRQGSATMLDEGIAENAYYPPAMTSPTPLLWIPRDPGGVSRQEVELTSQVIPITDDEAYLDEKNKVVWDKKGMRPPIWQEKIFY
ncbi:hypothetical protein VTO42DRAFT_7578 [Malbranchea cinnamomea]